MAQSDRLFSAVGIGNEHRVQTLCFTRFHLPKQSRERLPNRFGSLSYRLVFLRKGPETSIEVPPLAPLHHDEIGRLGSFDDLICIDPPIIEPVEIAITDLHPDSRDPLRAYFLTRQLPNHMLSVFERQFDEIRRPEISEPIDKDQHQQPCDHEQ